ncbi:MAG: DUF5103 domain-containing protein [Lachnospiraceae bacterium]|nr:DUF5103 domain-containing protein [Lachnospiraceae bacterium]
MDTLTGIFNEKVKTLEARLASDEMAPPVLLLDAGDQLIFSFDHLAEDRSYLRYRLVHCNADWQPSILVDTEFLNGFNEGRIDDYDFSQLTTTHYVHYELAIPNADVAPKASGNYLLQIYSEDDPNDIWLQCRFMVTEQTAGIRSEITSRTDASINEGHQQLSIAIDTERSGVADPYNDIILQVQQDSRLDNEATLRHPLRMNGRRVAIYEHMPELIFEAGNEYRRFEVISTTYPGMKVDNIAYIAPYYHATLMEDLPRSEGRYEYDQTQFGRFKIREYNSEQSDIEADYVVVHFSLDMPHEQDAMVFIDGDLTHRRFDPEALMTYNRATGRYERSMLLKQGAYNYQYLTLPKGKDSATTAPIEGNYYETAHEYLIKVYARSPGERYDRLIGVSTIYSGR